MAAVAPGQHSLKEYLKKYESDPKELKKKKKNKKPKNEGLGVLVVDEDPSWQNSATCDEEHNVSDGEKPQIDEDIEVKRMKRLEQLRSRRPYNSIAEDGSGWVSLSPNPVIVASRSTDMSPPRRQKIHDGQANSPMGGSINGDKVDNDLSPPRQRRRIECFSSLEEKESNASPFSRYTQHKQWEEHDSHVSMEEVKNVANLQDSMHQRRCTHEVEKKSSFSASHGTRSIPACSGLSSKEDFVCCQDPDLSPPRKNSKEPGIGSMAPKKQRKQSSDPTILKHRFKSGLMSARDFHEEASKPREIERLRYQKMDPSMSGKNAELVYRNKKGELMSKEELLRLEGKTEEKTKHKKPKSPSPEKEIEWGKGLVQKREAAARLEEWISEKDKPFARTRDDPELDKMLRERVRWGDPMAHLAMKKQSEPALHNLRDNEKMVESGFIIPQEIPDYSWIKRQLPPAPNRYGIRPGRHWDGVDRSNGFEEKLFKTMNERQASEREAYLWSVSDM